MPKRMLARLTLTGLSVFLIAAASAHDQDKRHRNSLVGSWVVSATVDGGMPPPFTNILTVTRDGNLTNLDASLGKGVGVWRRAGRGQFTLRFVHLVPADDPGFPPNSGAFLTVNGRITVKKGGASAEGGFLAVFEAPGLGELARLTGTVAFERITVHNRD